MEGIKQRYLKVLERVKKATEAAGLNIQPQICVVTKTQSVETINKFCRIHSELFNEPPILGENYVQEYAAKKIYLAPHRGHLIGPLQSNKIKEATDLFQVIQSVHKVSLLDKLQRNAERHEKQISIFIQVNISNDNQKAGFKFSEVLPLLQNWPKKYPHIKLLGGMTITAFYDDPTRARPDYAALREVIYGAFNAFPETFGGKVPALSMGMSDDFEQAIYEGATLVRIGSAIFGQRQ